MRILCFGDSNTYGYDPREFFGGQYDPPHRWVDLLAHALGCSIINAGENGRRIPAQAGERLGIERLLAGSQPLDLLIIMLGTNDLLQGLSPESVASRMADFLTAMNVAKEKILLVAPPPLARGEWVSNQALIEDSRQLGYEYRLLAERLGVRCAGPWQIPLAFDGVHFTEAGHVEFAGKLLKAISKG